MTYEELLTIIERYGFYSEELTKTERCLYVYSKYALANNDNKNVLAVLSFNDDEPKLEEIQFYSQFYITKDGIATADVITVDWADDELYYHEITPEKVDKKFQQMSLRIKTLAERAKLKRIKTDF